MKHRMHKVITFGAALLITFLLAGSVFITFPSPGHAEPGKATVSGRLKLLPGDKAPAGGIKMNIVISWGKEPDQFSMTDVIIPEGSDYVDYSLEIWYPGGTYSYSMKYGFYSIYKDYVELAYYDPSGYASGGNNPLTISSDVVSGVDLYMIKGHTVSGTISLPDGEKAPSGGIWGNVALFTWINVPYMIPEGESSVEYTIREIPGVYNPHLKVGIGLPYEAHEYYTSTGTTKDKDEAGYIDITNSDVSGINIELLPLYSRVEIDYADNMLETIVDDVSAMDEAIRSSSGKDQDALVGVKIDALKDAVSGIELIALPMKAVELANQIIIKTGDIIGSVENEASAEGLSRAVAWVAEKAAEKTGTEVIAVITGGPSAELNLDMQEGLDLDSRADLLSNTADSLMKNMRKYGMKEKLEKRLKVKMVCNTGINHTQTSVSAETLSRIAEKGIDRFEVSSVVATVSLGLKSITGVSGSFYGGLFINTSRLKDTSGLTQAQKEGAGENPVTDIRISTGNRNEKHSMESFSDQLRLSLPFVPGEGQDISHLTVYCINDDGTVENLGGFYDQATGTISFSTWHLCLFSVQECDVHMDDIRDGPLKAQLTYLASQGIITAEQDKFLPDNVVTRAQFAQWLVNAFRLVNRKAPIPENRYTDVESGSTYCDAIAITDEMGLMCGDGITFRPDEAISRQDLAVYSSIPAEMLKGLKVPADFEKYLLFSDSDRIDEPAKPPVGLVSKYGLMGAKYKKEFRPSDYSDKVEAALTIYRLYWLNNPYKNPVRDSDTAILEYETGSNGQWVIFSSTSYIIFTVLMVFGIRQIRLNGRRKNNVEL